MIFLILCVLEVSLLFPRIPAFTAALGGFTAQTCPEIGLQNKKEGIPPLLSVLTL